MAGVLRVTICVQSATIQSPLLCSVRGLRTYARPLRKDAKPAEPIKGIPYKNLSIGVPKEVWTNERRYTMHSISFVVCYFIWLVYLGLQLHLQ
jgi:hypothetical protein